MYWHILLPVRTKQPVSCESMINYSYMWTCVCVCLTCVFMHLKYVHLFKKAHKIRLKNTGWHHVVGKWCQSIRTEAEMSRETCWIRIQENRERRAQPSTTVSKTVSYSMVSPSIKPTLQQSVKLNDLFLVRTHCPMEKWTPCLLAANWLRWFRWSGQGELLMRACCRLKAGVQQSNKDGCTFHFPLCPFWNNKKKGHGQTHTII